jgi:hypothetical protein
VDDLIKCRKKRLTASGRIEVVNRSGKWLGFLPSTFILTVAFRLEKIIISLDVFGRGNVDPLYERVRKTYGCGASLSSTGCTFGASSSSFLLSNLLAQD